MSLLRAIPSYARSSLGHVPTLLHSHRPLILSQCFTDVPAMQRWSDLSYFKPFGDKTVEIELSEISNRGYGTRVQESFGGFIALLEKVPSARIYLAQFPLFENLPELRDDVRSSLIEKVLGHGEVYNTSVWIGRNAYTPLHHDSRCLTNLFIQIRGDKDVMMFPAEIPSGKLRLGTGTMRNTSAVDVWDEDIGQQGFSGRVTPGDGLIIPRGWWHTLQSDSEINMSVNWWFKVRES
jgi:Cupin-like domain